MADRILLIFTTWPDPPLARTAARTLVAEHLAACANLLPGVESIYRWEGQVETAGEVLVIFKTTPDRYPQLEARIRELHSYAVPEIVCLSADRGLPAYLHWVADSCA